MKSRRENLNKSFKDKHLLGDINLEVNSGQILGYTLYLFMYADKYFSFLNLNYQ